MQEIFEAARELGMTNRVSLNGHLLTIAYPPLNVVQLPVRDSAGVQAAIHAMREIHDRLLKAH
jgi:hypothetical protein